MCKLSCINGQVVRHERRVTSKGNNRILATFVHRLRSAASDMSLDE